MSGSGVVAIAINLTEEEIKEINAKDMGDGVYGFTYTWHNAPRQSVLNKIIENRDIDAWGIEGLSKTLQKYIEKEFITS
jgi:hypothetical protein